MDLMYLGQSLKFLSTYKSRVIGQLCLQSCFRLLFPLVPYPQPFFQSLEPIKLFLAQALCTVLLLLT